MSTVRTLLLGLAIVLAIGLYCQMQQPEPEPELHISNITEIQIQLRDAGYYRGPVDGKWGPKTDRAYCDWCASRSFE